MGATRAQQNRRGRQNYGRNYHRGRTAEQKAARQLRAQGYSVTISRGSRGPADIQAKKNGRTRRIQVKSLSSRSFSTETTARRRVKGEPFNVGNGREVWLYDKNGKCWKFKA